MIVLEACLLDPLQVMLFGPAHDPSCETLWRWAAVPNGEMKMKSSNEDSILNLSFGSDDSTNAQV